MVGPDAQRAPLVDVSDLAVDDLMSSTDPNLLACVQRLVSELDDPNGIISAFQSFASE